MRALQRLQSHGFEAYLVGGCVRDLLLGCEPKDFDMATGARPQQIKRSFPRNCRIIGRRFKLAHLHFNHNSKILELATFRTSPTAEREDSDDLLITRDNEFGTAEEDARRRDFTVNGLFFDPIADEIIDYVDGLADVEHRVLRTIGEPIVRFREDPVRIIRAAKFAGRLGFTIDAPTWAAMAEVAPDLSRSAPPRLLEEILRLLRGGHALDSFQLLRDIGALEVMLPSLAEFLRRAASEDRVRFWRTLEALDARVEAGVEYSSPVLLATLLSTAVRMRAERDRKRSPTSIAEAVIGPLAQDLRLPRRDAGCLKRICGVQARFTADNAGGKKFQPEWFLRDPFFAEALQLFELNCVATGENLDQLQSWRTQHGGSLPLGRRPTDVEEPQPEPTPPRESGHKGRDHGRRRRGDQRREVQNGHRGPPPRHAGREHGRDHGRERDRDGKRKRRERHAPYPQGKHRDPTIETIEPPPIDKSAFDVELDPKRVPSFGAIVEAGDGKKKRGPRVPPTDDSGYKPPPPPGQEPPVVPPPPTDEEFGDW